MVRSAKKSHYTPQQYKRDLAAIAKIRSSGILNRNAKLDTVLALSNKLSARAQAAGHIFIFTNVVLVKCKTP